MSRLNLPDQISRFVLGSIILSLSLGLARADKPVVVGDPANPATLAKAVQDAHVAGARRIQVREGVYYIPAGAGDVFRLDGWTNTDISGYGVTIITAGRGWPDSIFHLINCTNVSVDGFLLSQTTVTAYQGKVTAVDLGNGSSDAASYTWMPDAGYPILADTTAKIGEFNVVDGKTRQLKVGTADFYGNPCQNLGNNAFKITGFKTVPNIAVGDWLVMRNDASPIVNKIHFDNCANCTAKDISMMRNGFAAIFDTGGAGGNHYLGCKWLLGPKPAGATEDPVVSCSADGLHSADTVTGPDIEDCEMQGVMLDDCFAIHGGFTDIVSSTANTVTIKGDAWQFALDNPIRIADSKGFYDQATVTALTKNGDNTTTIGLDHNIGALFTDAKVFNPQKCGAGYKIINCKLGHTRSRGIIVKADDGLIQGNVIDGAQMSAVSIGPEFYWHEAGYVQHVEFSKNVVMNCGGSNWNQSAVLIHGDGAVGNSDITVHDNHFINNYSGEFQISCGVNISVAGNNVIGCKLLPASVNTPIFAQIDNCSKVNFMRNRLANVTAYKLPLIAIGKDVTQFTNDADGNKVATR